MSRDPLVKGWRGAAFAGVNFAKYVISWDDTRDRAGTVHKYNKRDGGEGEDMGREPHKASVRLAYIGPDWRKNFLELQSAIDDNPIGTLVHPLYGSMQAYARRSSGHMDLQDSPNYYEVSIEFEESQVDTKAKDDAATQSQQGPAAKQQAVTSAAANATQWGLIFTTAAPAVAALTSAATTYAAAAVASVTGSTPDATLAQQLATVKTLTDTAIAALLADPISAPGIVDPAYAAMELLYDTCTQVDDAARSLRPTLSLYTVPMTMHITALAQLLYGSVDGPSREAEILANNVGTVYDPAMIPAGLQILVAPATV